MWKRAQRDLGGGVRFGRGIDFFLLFLLKDHFWPATSYTVWRLLWCTSSVIYFYTNSRYSLLVLFVDLPSISPLDCHRSVPIFPEAQYSNHTHCSRQGFPSYVLHAVFSLHHSLCRHCIILIHWDGVCFFHNNLSLLTRALGFLFSRKSPRLKHFQSHSILWENVTQYVPLPVRTKLSWFQIEESAHK